MRGERGALRVDFDSAVVTARIETRKDVDLSSGPADVRRVVFALTEPADSGVVRLHVHPAS